MHVYRDGGGVLTGGIGHTGPGLVFGAAITPQQAEDWFEADIGTAASHVTSLAGNCTQGQFDAFTDFVFNLGPHALAGSTLLRKHLSGDFAGAAAEFPKWDHDNGVVIQGLLNRRLAERGWYLA